MASVLHFRNDIRRSRPLAPDRPAEVRGEPRGVIVIFPGVRLERGDIDLSCRLVRPGEAGDEAKGAPAGS